MGRKRKKSKSVSLYFTNQSNRMDKKFSSKYNQTYVSFVDTKDIRKIAQEVFGNPYGFKVK